MTAETPQSANWFTASNRINNGGVNPPWGYDAAGNLQQVGGTNRSFTYDADNRQVTATINGATASYVYDGNGLRVSKTVGGQTTTYVYDAWGTLAAEYGSFTTACNTPTCYVTVDHLGSTRMVTDDSGSSAHRYDYLPFGEQILSGTNGRSPGLGYYVVPDAGDPEFTGQYRDPETGLDWFNVRHMSGAQGRFQGVDPGNAGAAPGNPQSWNGYAYVGNNPLSYTDPTGLFGEATIALCGGGPAACAIGGLIDFGVLLAGLFGGGGPSMPAWSETVWALGPTQTTPVYNPSTLGARLNPSVLVVPGLIFTAEPTGKLPQDPDGKGSGGHTPPLAGPQRPADQPSCFGEFLHNWGVGLSPFPSDDPFEELTKNGLEGGAQAASKALYNGGLAHAAGRGLTYPFKSSIFPNLINGSKALEEVGLPIAIMYSGIRSYIEDLKERSEGTCHPFFGWL